MYVDGKVANFALLFRNLCRTIWKKGDRLLRRHRVIQVGCGSRGRQWAQVLFEHPEVEVVAFVDTDPEKLADFAVKYPDIQQYELLTDALLRESADFAVLVTPPQVHKEQCLELFDANLDILAEKPLALNIEDAVEIVSTAQNKNRKLSLSLNFRFLPVSQSYRKWISSETLGSPSFSLYHYGVHRGGYGKGGNRYPLTLKDAMILDQSIHHFDLMRYCFDSEIEAVTARSWNPSWSVYQSDSVVSTIFHMDNGMNAVYLGSWTSGWDKQCVTWRTDCSEGVLIMRQIHSDLVYARRTDTDLTPIPLEDAVPYIDDSKILLDRFLNARLDEGPLECDGVDHLLTLAASLACIEARDQRREVLMSDYYRENGLLKLFEDRLK